LKLIVSKLQTDSIIVYNHGEIIMGKKDKQKKQKKKPSKFTPEEKKKMKREKKNKYAFFKEY